MFASLLSACSSLTGQTSSDLALLESESEHINRFDSNQDVVADATYNLMVAELALGRGETKLAISSYLDLARSQQSPAIAERAVRVAVYGQNLEAAIEAAQRWIALDPSRVEARQVIAAIYIRQNRADEAFHYLDDLIMQSKTADAQLFPPLIGILAREKSADTVLSVSLRIAQKYPHRAYAQYMHGVLSAQNGRTEEALEYLDRSLAIADIDGAHSTRAKILLKLGRSKDAIISLRKALDKRPDDQGLRLTYARLLVDVKQYERARIEFEILRQASPEDPELLYTLGLLSLESQRLDDAETYMLKLVDIKQRDGEAQYYLGRINENRKQYEVAIDWYRKVHVGDYRFDSQLRIADLLGVSGHVDDALAHLDAMLKGSQSNGSLIRIYINKGGLLRDARRYKQAMEVYNTALDIVPGNSDLLYARALVAEKVGRIDILEADIKAILKTEPDNAHALNALGFTLADQTDRLDEAYGYLKRAIQIMPDDAAIIDSLGWVNYRLGNYEEAVKLLRKALSRFDDSEIAAHLGEVLWVSGKQDEARSIWQRALKKSPDDPFLREVMQRFIP